MWPKLIITVYLDRGPAPWGGLVHERAIEVHKNSTSTPSMVFRPLSELVQCDEAKFGGLSYR